MEQIGANESDNHKRKWEKPEIYSLSIGKTLEGVGSNMDMVDFGS